jgi:dUTP pyrophosphatase
MSKYFSVTGRTDLKVAGDIFDIKYDLRKTSRELDDLRQKDINDRLPKTCYQYSPSFRIKKLFAEANIPNRSDKHAAGFDLYSAEDMVIPGHGRNIVKTGIAMSIPDGMYGKIEGRSGLAIRFGVDVLGGVIDSNYRGEIKVILINHDTTDFEIVVGNRIAQIIFHKYEVAHFREVDTLEETSRGDGGFGSTGV